jgi:outer membrane receptor protein involved in Fe transport
MQLREKGVNKRKSNRCSSGVQAAIAAVGLMAVASFLPSAFAQSNVEGTIAGSAPANSSVLIQGLDSGVSITSTPRDGRFRVGSLPAGRYEVTVKEEGKADRSETVVVSIGGTARVDLNEAQPEIETIEVIARKTSIDVAKTETSLDLSAVEIAELPIPRAIQSVALLAPGTTKGDAVFGSQVSFGGASVAENMYYFNGFNITDFREGLGFSEMPFEFIANTQVKTGGYGAEFGRSLGGVVNMTSKRGSDTFESGVSVFWEPKFLSYKSSAVSYYDDNGTRSVWYDRRRDRHETTNANVYASGALIPGRLYVYGLISFERTDSQFGGSVQTFNKEQGSNPFYALKADFYLTQDHWLEMTYFRNKEEVERDRYYYDNFAQQETSYMGGLKFETGGNVLIGKYTGRITDDLTLSLLYGQSKVKDDTTNGDNSCIYGLDDVSGVRFGCAATSMIDKNDDQRDAYRIDLQYAIGGHLLRAGMDYEELEVENADFYTGPGHTLYLYYPNRNTPGGSYALEATRLENFGNFKSKTSALYLEDTWQVTDRFSIYAGLRNETFQNFDANGKKFFDVDDQWAPRLGLSFDVLGGGRSKLYANWGRYYLPVATATNIRVGGAELSEYIRYETYGGIAADGSPISRGTEVDRGYYNNADGTVHDSRQLVDQEGIKPMYQEEYSIGFQLAFSRLWNGGIRFIHRDLKRSIEDLCIDGIVLDASCVMANPGTDITIYTGYDDADNDGIYGSAGDNYDPNNMQPLTLTADRLGFPKAERKYNAVELTVARASDQHWKFDASYTWAQSYGNAEGYVNSDIGQADAGITQSFDYPGLVEHSYGYLPNDRRHNIKAYGAYFVTPELSLGLNLQVSSGRPKNCFGNYPDSSIEIDGDYSGYYGASSFYCSGQPSPRGSRGRTPWTSQVDLSMRFTPQAFEGLALGVDVFNVFNSTKVTQIKEAGEDGSLYYSAGLESASYGSAERWQAPMYVRLSAEYRFSK